MNLPEKINNIFESDIKSIIMNPHEFEIEICGTAYDVLSEMIAQLKSMQIAMKSRIINEMETEEATKLHYLNTDGEQKTITLKNPTPKCDLKIEEIKKIIEENNFDISQFGSMEYKLCSWSDAKKMRKTGGTMKKIIDKLFTSKNKYLIIEK